MQIQNLTIIWQKMKGLIITFRPMKKEIEKCLEIKPMINQNIEELQIQIESRKNGSSCNNNKKIVNKILIIKNKSY